MTRYPVQPREQIFVKGCGFLSFAKNMGRSFGKKMSKKLSNKYSQKLFDHAKQSATDATKRAIRCTQNCFKKSNSKINWK